MSSAEFYSQSQNQNLEFSLSEWEEDGWQIAQCLNYDVVSQGNTSEEALINLKEALELAWQEPIPILLSTPPRDIGKSESQKDLKLSFRQIRFKLEAANFMEVKQLGNHAKFIQRYKNKIYGVVLPHYTDISYAVLACALRQSGLSIKEFLAL